MGNSTSLSEDAPSPITEITTLHIKGTREQAIAGQIKPLGDAYIPSPGFRGIRWGFQIEDPKVLYWFAEWESMEAARKLHKTKTYTSLVGAVGKFAEISLVHAPVSVPDAPVIEWCVLKLETDTVKEEWLKNLDALKEVMETARDKGYKGISTGWSHQCDREFMVLVGWESKEAHTQWKEGLDPELAEKGLALFRGGVKNVSMVHMQVEGRIEGKPDKKGDETVVAETAAPAQE